MDDPHVSGWNQNKCGHSGKGDEQPQEALGFVMDPESRLDSLSCQRGCFKSKQDLAV